MRKIILLTILLMSTGWCYGQWDINNQWDTWSVKETAEPVADTHDTTRLFAEMINLTQSQKYLNGTFIQDLKDTMAHYSGVTMNNLSDGLYLLFNGAINDSDNVGIEWTGQYHFYEVRNVKHEPFIGAYSNNNDSAYYKTDFKFSDILQKSKFSMMTLVRSKHDLTYSGGDFQYEFGSAVFNDSSGKTMGLSWDDNRSFMSLGGEHTAVTHTWIPYMSFGTRNGVEAGTDSLWLFYNGFRVPAAHYQHAPLDSVPLADSTIDILACNFNGVHKHFTTRKLAYFTVFKHPYNSIGAEAIAKVFYKLDRSWNVITDFEADTLFARMTTLPDSDKVGINEAITRIKDSLQITKLNEKFDQLNILSANDTTNALMDWTTNQNDAISINTPTFTEYEGFTTTSTGAKYINTLYNPYEHASTFAWQTNHFGYYSWTDNSVTGDNGYSMGNKEGSLYYYQIGTYSDGKSYGRQQDKSSNASNTNSTGFYINSSQSATSFIVSKNGELLYENTQTRSSLNHPNYPFFVGCYNSAGTPAGYSLEKFGLVTIGRNLTLTQHRMLYNIWKLYYARKGKTI